MVQKLYRHGFWVQCGRGFEVDLWILEFTEMGLQIPNHLRSDFKSERAGENTCIFK